MSIMVHEISNGQICHRIASIRNNQGQDLRSYPLAKFELVHLNDFLTRPGHVVA